MRSGIAAQTAATAPIGPLNPEAVAFVDAAISDNRVTIFALDWCEFCWSVRKLFARLNIDYKSVDLDSVAFREEGLGGKIRTVLKERIGSPTIPQIYIGRRHLGGCTELFDAMREGRMQEMLDECGATYERSIKIDPYELLPKWVHPRKSA